MTSANSVTEMNGTVIAECAEREAVWPWHELDYALLEVDSDRILADALTPQAVVLLARLGNGPADPPRPSPPAAVSWTVSWTVSAPPAPEIRATQRSPPRIGRPVARAHLVCDADGKG